MPLPALTFPDTSLLIKVVRSSERKIDEKAALLNELQFSKSMTLNQIKLQASFAECVVPPTIQSLFAFEAGLTVPPNSFERPDT